MTEIGYKERPEDTDWRCAACYMRFDNIGNLVNHWHDYHEEPAPVSLGVRIAQAVVFAFAGYGAFILWSNLLGS